MKTVHISGDIPKKTALMKMLYKKVLKENQEFHYFLEASDIIIRIEEQAHIEQILNILYKERGITVEVYDYPFAPKGRYGDAKGSVTTKFSHLYLPMYHLLCVSYLTLSNEDWEQYKAKILHGACNIEELGQFAEGEYFASLIIRKFRMLDRIVGEDTMNSLEERFMLK